MLLDLDIRPLEIPFKVAFSHSSATRLQGHSVWVCARRGPHTGVGEGCPRAYVTGEMLPRSLDFLASLRHEVSQRCVDLASTREFVWTHRDLIDRNPAAWCAMECALLDLFAREQGLSLDALLGLGDPQGTCHYSAVLDTQSPTTARPLIALYARMGMLNYKLKIADDAEHVHAKIAMIHRAHLEANLPTPLIRLDANNHWHDDLDTAMATLQPLRQHIIAIEEPLSVRAFEALSTLSRALDLPIILDESVATAQDARRIMALPGTWILNLKISKLGGLLRAIAFIHDLGAARPDIILGAHVGETSVLTRASQVLWRHLEGDVFAHEGAFGERLLEYDMVHPSIEFAHGGQVDLRRYAGPGWGLSPAEVMR